MMIRPFVDNNSILSELISYFERVWIREKKRNRRTAPMFPISLWNVYDSVNLQYTV